MTVDNLEDIPGYAGIVGDVEENDVYGLRKLDFTPTLIFDIGANVGVFARHARKLFPEAYIVCVEPDKENFQNLCKFTEGPGFFFFNLPIGNGQMWHYLNAPSIGHQCYMSAGLGYPAKGLTAEEGKSVERVKVSPMTLVELDSHVPFEDEEVFLKMDIEGNEHTVFTDPESMAILRKCTAFAIEVHKYALTHELIEEVQARTDEALKSLEDEFDTHWEHVVFHARKRD